MTTLEVKHRDGLARISVLALDGEKYHLPAVLDTVLVFPSLGRSRMENVPLSADREFALQYLPRHDDPPRWVHPAGEAEAESGDCIMVPCWHTALENPRRYVGWVVDLKKRLPPDTAWYAPAAALPSNVHILCYTGFDIFDFTGTDLKSAQGVFCLPEGEFPREWMERGICGCQGCRESDLRAHNRLALLAEVARVREYIRASSLRELVESRSRMKASQVGILRRLDFSWDFSEQVTPVARSTPLLATTGDCLFRAEVRRFADRVITRYIPPAAEVAVLLPCSAKKPYSLSRSHRLFSQAVAGRAAEFIITSPLGLVPRELELVYPAAHYDVPVTGYWDAEEKSFVSGIMQRFFERNRYRRVIAHLDGGTLEAARIWSDSAGVDIEVTCTGRPTSPESLKNLEDALAGEGAVRHDLLRGTGSWQFDHGIDTSRLRLKVRYPEVRAFLGKAPAFSLDQGTGLLKPTFEGWTFIPEGYRVVIDDFVPQGDVLAPGICDADPRIREGDEVLVVNSLALATGKAAMPAGEMLRSRRGVAVKVRKVKRL